MRFPLILSLVLAFLAMSVAAAESVSTSPGAEASAWGPLDLGSGIIEPGSKRKFTFETNRSFESSLPQLRALGSAG